MLAHTRKNKLLALDILEESFQDNPSVLNAVKNDKHVKRRIHILIRFMVNMGIRNNGLIISDCKNEVIIAFRYDTKKTGIGGLWDMAMLALFGTGLQNVTGLLEKENYMAALRPKDHKYYYGWLSAVRPEKRGGRIFFDLYQKMCEEAMKHHLDLYYETSVERNIKLYQHKGAEVFHTFPLKDGTKLFCLRHKLT